MRTEYLVAIAIAAFVAGAGLAVHSVQSPAEYPEAVRTGLLTPAGQPAPPATRLAPVSGVRGSVFGSVRWLTTGGSQNALAPPESPLLWL
jgi:hypothetical protein